ncbi:MAG: efflux RND transporter periplasmic adaptor subunit [Chitinophagaceae bacterium]
MKKFKWLIILLVIVLAGVAIWYWKFREKEKPVVLDTEQPHYGSIATSITATGTIQPVDTVSVGTQVSGTIKSVYTDYNAVVKKGQLLAELDKVLLLAQVQQFSGSLQQAKSQLVYQESNYSRQKSLFDVGAISRADYETALYQYNTAKDNVTSVGAQLKTANRNLELADIYSPIDGTVLSRNISAGQTVAASFSTPTLFVIAKDLTRMQVRAAVDEADIGNVKTGQRASFSVDAFPNDVFEGTVKEIRLQPSVSSNVVTYVTIIDAPNEMQKLKPGMTASITIYTKEVENALLVSAKAVKYTPDSAMLKNYVIDRGKQHEEGGGKSDASKEQQDTGTLKKQHPRMNGAQDTAVKAKRSVVWVLNGNVITKRVIHVGITDDANVQVIDGLTPEDVVVNGAETGSAATANANSGVRSPFMPARRGGSSGSGSGGGGNRPR